MRSNQHNGSTAVTATEGLAKLVKKNLVTKTGWNEKKANTANEPKNFARVTVKRWLKNNASRFQNTPRITDVRKNGFFLKFKGISPQIVLSIHHGYAFEVWVSDDKGNWWDMLTDFDIDAEQDSAGQYYCSLCVEAHREFYASKRELWEKHSLELALVWVNENLRPDRWLCLFGTEGSRWVELVDAEKLPEWQHAENFYAAFRVGVR